MDIMALEVQLRDKNHRAKDLLNQNLIPMEYYGSGVENKSLQVDYQTFRRLFRVAGTNTVIELNVDGKEKINVLVHDMQRDPVTSNIKHVDLINVRMDQEIHTKIPVELTGTAPAVKEQGGILMHHLNEVEIKCLPKDLVHSFLVSVESLVDFHSYVRVKDLEVPEGITILNGEEDLVATVVAPREEEAEIVEEAAEAGGEGGAEAGAEGEGEGEGGAEAGAEEKSE